MFNSYINASIDSSDGRYSQTINNYRTHNTVHQLNTNNPLNVYTSYFMHRQLYKRFI